MRTRNILETAMAVALAVCHCGLRAQDASEAIDSVIYDLSTYKIHPDFETIERVDFAEIYFPCDIFLRDNFKDLIVTNQDCNIYARNDTLFVDLAEPLVENGIYLYVLLPEGSLGDAEWKDSGYTSGHSNKRLEYWFGVTGANTPYYVLEPDEVTPLTSDRGAVQYLDTIGLYYNLWGDMLYYDNEDAAVTLRDESGTLYPCTFDPEFRDGWFTIRLEQRIEKPGLYTLEIPKGAFGNIDWIEDKHSPAGGCNPQLIFSWRVADDNDFDALHEISADSSDIIFDIQGVPHASETLHPGFYIVRKAGVSKKFWIKH